MSKTIVRDVSGFEVVVLIFVVTYVNVLAFRLVGEHRTSEASFSGARLMAIMRTRRVPTREPTRPDARMGPTGTTRALRRVAGGTRLSRLLSGASGPIIIGFFTA